MAQKMNICVMSLKAAEASSHKDFDFMGTLFSSLHHFESRDYELKKVLLDFVKISHCDSQNTLHITLDDGLVMNREALGRPSTVRVLLQIATDLRVPTNSEIALVVLKNLSVDTDIERCIVECGGIELLIFAAQCQSSDRAKDEAMLCLRNITYFPAHRWLMASTGGIPLFLDRLRLREAFMGKKVNIVQSENAIAALSNLSTDAAAVESILNARGLDHFAILFIGCNYEKKRVLFDVSNFGEYIKMFQVKFQCLLLDVMLVLLTKYLETGSLPPIVGSKLYHKLDNVSLNHEEVLDWSRKISDLRSMHMGSDGDVNGNVYESDCKVVSASRPTHSAVVCVVEAAVAPMPESFLEIPNQALLECEDSKEANLEPAPAQTPLTRLSTAGERQTTEGEAVPTSEPQVVLSPAAGALCAARPVSEDIAVIPVEEAEAESEVDHEWVMVLPDE